MGSTGGAFTFGAILAVAIGIALAEPRFDTGVSSTPAVPARSIVLFTPMLPAYLTIDDGSEHIRAVSRHQVRELSQGLLRYAYRSALDLPIVPTAGWDTTIPGDPEQVLALAPDAVMSWSHFSGPLRKVGVPLVEVPLDPEESDEDIKDLWRLIGRVADRMERTQNIIRHYDQARGKVLSALDGQGSPPRVLYVYQKKDGSLLVAFGRTRETELLEAVGAINIGAALRGPELSAEQLLVEAPDVIVVSGYAAGNAVDAVYDDPAFRNLPAIRNRRVYRQPTGGARMSGLVEEPVLLQWLAEIVHPDTAPMAFRDMLREAYETIYGVTLSDDMIDETLRFDENANSAGFDRFHRGYAP